MQRVIRARRLLVWLAAFGMTACVVGAAPAPDTSAAGEVKMTLLPSGAVEKIGGYTPQETTLGSRKPAAVRKAPKTAAALYGRIPFGGREYLVVLDEPEDEDARLYVDANGNGDLTDDPVPAWEKATARGPRGEMQTRHSGTFQLTLAAPHGSGAGAAPKAAANKASSQKDVAAAGRAPEGERVTLHVFRIEWRDPRNLHGRKLNSPLKYYADYAYEGEVTLGGKAYRAMLADRATGRFTARGPEGTAALLFLDANGDGAFTPPGEMFE